MISPLQGDGPPVVLCIAGFDPSGGAGLLADARACAAMRAHAICVPTALVPQNTCGAREMLPLEPEQVRLQAQTLLEDVPVAAIKVGLMPNLGVLEAVLEIVRPLVREKDVPLVLDPVFAPTQGPSFTDETTVHALVEHLFPLASLVTPNAVEAASLSGQPVRNFEEMTEVARVLWYRTETCAVLVKGGHVAPILAKRRDDARGAAAQNTTHLVLDVFFDGRDLRELRSPHIEGTEVRGTGCLLSSAIAAQLARGVAPFDAVRLAKHWLTRQIEGAQSFGQGRRIAAF